MAYFYVTVTKSLSIFSVFALFTSWRAAKGSCPASSFGQITNLQGDPTTEPCSCSSIFIKRESDAFQLDEKAAEYECKSCNTWNSVENITGEYMIPDGSRTFQNSRAVCQSCGGDVIVLNTTDLVSQIKLIMDVIRNRERNLWIGIVRNATHREFFEWMDGRPFNETDIAWHPGQPNDRPGVQDCVGSFYSDSWMLEDKQCHETYNILCQRPGFQTL